MKTGKKNSYKSLKTININGETYKYYSLLEAEKNGLKGISKLPKSLKVILENLLRYEDEKTVTRNQIEEIKNWLKNKKSSKRFETKAKRAISRPSCRPDLVLKNKNYLFNKMFSFPANNFIKKIYRHC